MSAVRFILYISALALFYVSAYVNDWLTDLKQVIAGINMDFWIKLPFVFQVVFIGVFCAICVGLIASIFNRR